MEGGRGSPSRRASEVWGQGVEEAGSTPSSPSSAARGSTAHSGDTLAELLSPVGLLNQPPVLGGSRGVRPGLDLHRRLGPPLPSPAPCSVSHRHEPRGNPSQPLLPENLQDLTNSSSGTGEEGWVGKKLRLGAPTSYCRRFRDPTQPLGTPASSSEN